MTHNSRLAHVNKMLDRYHAQLAGLENAKLTAGAEEKVRLDQRIEDLREEMRPYEEERSRLSPPVSSATSPTPPIVTPVTPMPSSATPGSEPLSVFISYAHIDEKWKDQLVISLANLQRQDKIRAWHDRDIEAGAEWESEIEQQLESAEIILLLITPDFIYSQYCFDLEMQRAVERHNQGTARVIPIIVRPCDWQESPFSRLQVLPRDAKPISTWSDRDEAFLNVVQGIRRAVESLQAHQRNSVNSVVTPEPTPRSDRPVSSPRSNLNEVRCNQLKKNYDRLLRQYQATAEKAELTLNPGDKIKLEEDANNLWQQLEKVDQELRQLDR